MRAASIARSTSSRTPSASSASASTRCRMRSRSWRSSGCSIGSTRWAIRTYELFYTNRFGQEIWRELRGTRRRLRGAAILHPSRPAAGGHLSGGARPARRIAHPHRSSPRRVSSGRGRRDRLFLRPPRRASRDRARRRADRRRRHPFAGARHALSERRPGALERRHALARRRRLADVPHRPLDGDRRRHGREARRLSDRRGGAARPAADQLGGGRQDRRRLDPAAEQGGLVAAGTLRGPDAARAALPHPVCQRAGADRGDARILGISDVRPRSAAALVAWPRHAARRCRASDVSGRLERRLAGDPRRALPRRPAADGRASVARAVGATSRSGCR